MREQKFTIANEVVRKVNSNEYDDALLVSWVMDAMDKYANIVAIDFAAWKEQVQLPKPLESLWQSYLDSCKLDELKKLKKF